MGRMEHRWRTDGSCRGPSRLRKSTAALVVAAAAAAFSAFVATYAGAADGQPSISVGDGAALEGVKGVATVVPVAVTLSGASTDTVTVRWTTVDGTADDDNDYHAASGLLTFVPGDTAETIEVEISGGENAEWNEYFTIFLFQPTNATISRAIGKVTIINDDGTPPGVEPGEANVAPAGGDGQCGKLNNGAGCQPLDQGQLVDIDDVLYINPGLGRVQVTSNVGVAAFYGGKFAIDEIPTSGKVSRPISVIRLVGGSFKQCTAAARTVAATKKPIRRLWGKGKGRFRTRGRYASGTVRGTSWITEDFCDGTRTRVFSGVVRVYDLVTKKFVVLKAGQSYFAKAGLDK
jgi:hypothetical protein